MFKTTPTTGFRSTTSMLCVAVLSIFALGSCAASGANGGLLRSPDVTHQFRTYGAVPAYRYYHSGWSNNPYAIVAIDPQYTLKDRLWTPFTPDSATLKNLMDALYEDFNLSPYGAYIVDQQGKRIGLWYSAIQWAAIRVDEETHTIDIIPDTPYLRDDPRFFSRFGGHQIPAWRALLRRPL